MYLHLSYRHLPNQQRDGLGGTEIEWLNREVDLNCYYFCEESSCIAYIFTKYHEQDNVIEIKSNTVPSNRSDVYNQFVQQLRREGYARTTEIKYTFTHSAILDYIVCEVLKGMQQVGFVVKSLEWIDDDKIQISMSLVLN